ncbi:TIGR04063 family PEP-CTERM/XrtA system glycosyltransferase [Sphingosinicella microcystinivorans]|uniref:TIGR04063 family PEP-CTERM/XrtA system glycosyltransferase n=1 Tax=Sphingosinicella microcystinivorans TaxID=335406 RepID=UPI003B675564
MAIKPLHILDHSLPLHSGYTFRSRALIEGQRRLGWQPLMLTTPRHYADGPDPETVDGLTFHRTRRAGPPILGEIAATSKRLDALIEAEKPDLLHAHSPVLTFAAAWGASRRHNLPLVYEIRAFWEDAAVGNGTGREGDLKYRLTRAAESWACRQADAVGAICKGLLGDLRARGIDEAKLFEIPNAVDLAQFGDPLPHDAALAAELGLEDAEVVGFLGSFYDYEGLDILIAAMPRLVAARPKAHLLLVGGGPMETSLRAAAAASSASDRIRFVGRVPHSEVDRYYSLVDVLAYPRKAMRLTELVTPLKPLEAMAQEKLVAASNVGGHRELIEDGITGTLFAADDPDAAADALIGLLADRDTWPARRARAKLWVSAERNWDRSVAAYVPVYERLLNRAR